MTNSPLTQNVIQYFTQICGIYRRSKHEEGVCRYLESFAKENGLAYFCDEFNNVVMCKEGIGIVPYILQAHTDMVCVPTSGYDWSHGVTPVTFGDHNHLMKAKANGVETSLGADDGIGVAVMLGLLADKQLKHPPLIAIFTASEELDMSGAENLSFDRVKVLAQGLDLSKASFVNLDEEEDGVFCVGCAGGITTDFCIPKKLNPLAKENTIYHLQIGGLCGGHSGVEIDTGRANAHKVMGRLLSQIKNQIPAFALVSIFGGEARNVITPKCEAVIGIPTEQQEALHNLIKNFTETLRNEYSHIEPNLNITAEKAEGRPDTAQDNTTRDTLIRALLLMPNGVLAMDKNIPGLVETSSNLGIIKETDTELCLTGMIRSSVESRKAAVTEQFAILAETLGCKLHTEHDYPGWDCAMPTALYSLFEQEYNRLFTDKKAGYHAIHAGLECGLFAKMFEGIDMIALGPTVTGVHSVQETLDLDTVGKLVLLLSSVLERTTENMK